PPPRAGIELGSASGHAANAATIEAVPLPPDAARELRASCAGAIPFHGFRPASDRPAGPASWRPWPATAAPQGGYPSSGGRVPATASSTPLGRDGRQPPGHVPGT